MGGEGSGRKPDPIKAMRRQEAMPSKPITEDLHLPNLSGVKDEARKTSTTDITAGNDNLGDHVATQDISGSNMVLTGILSGGNITAGTISGADINYTGILSGGDIYVGVISGASATIAGEISGGNIVSGTVSGSHVYATGISGANLTVLSGGSVIGNVLTAATTDGRAIWSGAAGGGGGGSGAWRFVKGTTIGTGANKIGLVIGNTDDFDYLKIYWEGITGTNAANTNLNMRFNESRGNDYATLFSEDVGVPTENDANPNMTVAVIDNEGMNTSGGHCYGWVEVSNTSGAWKYYNGKSVSTIDAPPNHVLNLLGGSFSGGNATTSGAPTITSVQMDGLGGNIGTGASILVWGLTQA